MLSLGQRAALLGFLSLLSRLPKRDKVTLVALRQRSSSNRSDNSSSGHSDSSACACEALGLAWLWADSSGLVRPQVPWPWLAAPSMAPGALAQCLEWKQMQCHSQKPLWPLSGSRQEAAGAPLRAHLNPTLSLLLPAPAGCPLTGFTLFALLGPCWGFCCE